MSLCDGDCSKCLVLAEEQPFGVDIRSADGLMIKQMIIPRAGTYVPTHAHRYDHTSLLTKGSVNVWIDGVGPEMKSAPCGIFVKAYAKHTFEALEDETMIFCIHNTSRHASGEIEVHEEHQIVGVS